jgi:hypothetical protein
MNEDDGQTAAAAVIYVQATRRPHHLRAPLRFGFGGTGSQ